MQHFDGFIADGFHRAQERRFLIERFTAVRIESGRDAEAVLLDEGVGSRVPGCIAACLKGCAQAARRERRCIRLALDELLAGEFKDRTACAVRRKKAVVLLRGDAGHRLEPMGEVCCTVFDGPFTHCACDDIRDGRIEILAVCDSFMNGAVYCFRQTLLHDGIIEYKTSEIISQFHNISSFLGGGQGPRPFLQRNWLLLHNAHSLVCDTQSSA